MLRYKPETRPGLVALYDIRPGNRVDLFSQTWSPHRASVVVIVVAVLVIVSAATATANVCTELYTIHYNYNNNSSNNYYY